jgi:methylglutaconyl-CoA hydratase
VQLDGAVLTLTLDSPHNRNALSSPMLDELAEALHDATTNPAVRAVVLTGTGTVFCSGADLSERAGVITTRMPDIMTGMTSCPVPVIVRVNGHARAGGMGLIASADMAVAPQRATFAFSEVRVGVAPAMIMVPSLRITDRRFLTRKVLTGEVFDAQEAAKVGILTDAVEDDDALTVWINDVVNSILKCAPGAVKATKSLLRSLPSASWSDALNTAQRRSAELFASAEAAEGSDAFLNKRTPSWDSSTS